MNHQGENLESCVILRHPVSYRTRRMLERYLL